MMDAYHLYFRYNPGVFLLHRPDYDSDTWWNWVRGQIDEGWPAHYTMTDHAMVLDGYLEESGSRFYHFNMGWAGGSPPDPCWDPYPNTNTWYAMNAIPCNDPSQESEYMVGSIRPLPRVTYPVSGTYPKPPFPYRYFQSVASEGGFTSTGAVFESGQYLQFHRDARIFCQYPGPILFRGAPSGGSTYMFNDGDPTSGIRIDNGAIAMYWGGYMKLHWNN
jgi:hypothetical protein